MFCLLDLPGARKQTLSGGVVNSITFTLSVSSSLKNHAAIKNLPQYPIQGRILIVITTAQLTTPKAETDFHDSDLPYTIYRTRQPRRIQSKMPLF